MSSQIFRSASKAARSLCSASATRSSRFYSDDMNSRACSRMTRILKEKPVSNLLDRFIYTRRQFCLATRSLRTLAFEEIRSSAERPHTSTAFFLHGLLGKGCYWRSFAQILASNLSGSSAADWRMVLVDLRNHGRSAETEGLDPPHDMVSSAKDLANLIKCRGWAWPDVVIGHSLGAKVALQFAESCASGDYGPSTALPKQVWVLDSDPREVNPENSDGEVEILLQTLKGLPSSIPSRKWLVDHMIRLGFPKRVSEWIGSNLKKSGDQETWAFNLEGIIQMFSSHREMSYWSLLEQPPKGMEIAMVCAEKNGRWNTEVIQQLESFANQGDGSKGKVSVHVLPNSGHWVHVDNPKGLLEIMAPKIASLY